MERQMVWKVPAVALVLLMIREDVQVVMGYLNVACPWRVKRSPGA